MRGWNFDSAQVRISSALAPSSSALATSTSERRYSGL